MGRAVEKSRIPTSLLGLQSSRERDSDCISGSACPEVDISPPYRNSERGKTRDSPVKMQLVFPIRHVFRLAEDLVQGRKYLFRHEDHGHSHAEDALRRIRHVLRD